MRNAPPRTFMRLVLLQSRTWSHGHRTWAKAIGERIRQMKRDYPDLPRI